jgi:hypothetical protein
MSIKSRLQELIDIEKFEKETIRPEQELHFRNFLWDLHLPYEVIKNYLLEAFRYNCRYSLRHVDESLIVKDQVTSQIESTNLFNLLDTPYTLIVVFPEGNGIHFQLLQYDDMCFFERRGQVWIYNLIEEHPDHWYGNVLLKEYISYLRNIHKFLIKES